MILIISWLAGILGSICPIPQAYRAIIQKNTQGVSKFFIILWLMEKLCSLIYTIHLGATPLIIKYFIGLICAGTLAYYRFIYKSK